MSTHTENLAVIAAMRKYGGSFVKSLAETFLLADEDNFEKLKTAFPEYWQKYKEFAGIAEAKAEARAAIAKAEKNL